MKPLEAFNRLKSHTLSYSGSAYKEATNSKELIDKDLLTVELAIEENEWLKTEIIGQSQELKAKREALEIIKSFANYQVVKVQGQWYLIQGTSFDKSPKKPITQEQAILLQEVLI